MTSGAVIFAFNNSVIDYVAMADWSAANIHRHLDLPVCVITDAVGYPFKNVDQVVNVVNDQFNTRPMDEFQRTVDWHNMNRMDVLDLTPWDHTIVLDADYVVASPQLKILLDSPDFLCHGMARDVAGIKPDGVFNVFGNFKMPMLWATVMSFRRTQQAKDIFHIMKMIRNNWRHYCDLFSVNKSSYRNDFALTIASCVVNGHTMPKNLIPWSLSTVMPEYTVTLLEQDRYRIDFKNPQNQTYWMELRGQDFHAMGKQFLGAIVASAT